MESFYTSKILSFDKNLEFLQSFKILFTKYFFATRRWFKQKQMRSACPSTEAIK